MSPKQVSSETSESDAHDGSEVDRLLASARDALTDDMVARLAQTAGGGLDLLDRINRSGVADALPTLSRMVKDGDLDRIANLARLVGSAEDALTDDMISRLAQTTAGGLDLLDRVNRSGINKALPAIAALVENGDLERLVGLARVIGAAQDALSEDIINRLALIAGELLCSLERVARNPGLFRLLDLISRPEIQSTLEKMLEGLSRADGEVSKVPRSKGGYASALALLKDPGTQDALQFASAFGRQFGTTRT